mgnify:CR=1 FL=1
MLKNLVKNLKPSSTLLINETSKKLEDQGASAPCLAVDGLSQLRPRRDRENENDPCPVGRGL